MLYYSGKSKNAYQVIKAEQKKKFQEFSLKKTWWWKWVRLILQTAISIANAIIAKFIDTAIPGLGTALEFIVDTLVDLIFNLIENEGKIDWLDFGITVGFNSVGTIAKGFKLFKAARSHNKVLSLADNIIDNNVKFKKQFKTNAKTLATFGTEELVESANSNYKAVKETTEKILKTLNKSQGIFKQTATQSKKVFDSTNKFLNKTTKVFTKIRTFVSLLISPRFAAKKAIDFAIKKPRKKIVKAFNKFASEKVKKVFFAGKKTLKESLKRIPLNSSWLDSITILQSDSVWDLKSVNAVIRFKKYTKKKPVILWQKDSKLIMEFLTTNSPGKHYLRYFAWGWDIGKILRRFNGFIALSTIPLFSNLISTIASSYRTINAIHESIKKDKWLWSQDKDTLIQEFKKGAKEGLLKGWNFKYIRPIESFTRSIIENKPMYAIKSTTKAIKKGMFYKSFSNTIKNYSYSKPKGIKKWKKK
ncbi:hypothetical protein ACJA25_00505 [Mycoplasmopsis hyopharyngis]|uniref:hypothetical protein n=1 Tax=Mycoplasmopsis hyopharyngis TaxID=29558 RepID=UPI003872AD40